ncbi:MAG: phosphate ABC transporter substrate-binding protein [Candidatus Sumerlaeia bacterium]|nr:phosphate ABC transporter substrate-binding protein [Candidatus Sumerlaeia bacterium]
MIQQKMFHPALLILAFGVWGLACQKPSETSKPKSGGDAKPAQAAGKVMMIKGSDTMVHLVTAWAEVFMKKHPDVQIAVTGGGSGTGIAALINGQTDLCAASREINEKEKKDAEAKGIHPTEFSVARDGIAVVVNPKNPVSELTMEQVKKIYTGALTNWNQVGGPDAAITVLSRESSSGTYVFFQEHVLEKADYSPKVRLMPATSAIIQETAANASAIGYVGLGYAAEAGDKIKMVKIKAKEDAPAVTPSEETVKAGTYPIARALYLYANGQPTGVCKEFLDFCTSPEGEKIVRENGYVTVK